MKERKSPCTIAGPVNPEGMSCCKAHDQAWQKGEFWAKIVSDFVLLFCVISTYVRYDSMALCVLSFAWRVVLGLLMFAVVMTLGWLLWLKYLCRRLFGWFPKAKDA